MEIREIYWNRKNKCCATWIATHRERAEWNKPLSVANGDRLVCIKYNYKYRAKLRQILRPSANSMSMVDHRHGHVERAYCNNSNHSMNLVEKISNGMERIQFYTA